MKYRGNPKYRGVLSEQPFTYIDIPEESPPKRKFIPHIKFDNLTGQLDLEVKTVSDYLFVGSGGYDFHNGNVYYTFFRSNGNIAIPGTSIKGAVRSVAEAISNSCVSQLAGKKKVGKNRFKQNERKYIHSKHTHHPCTNPANLCPACRIFGLTGYGGRVIFSDAFPSSSLNKEIKKIGELFGPTIVKAQRKFYHNKKFKSVGNLSQKSYRFVEAIKKGSIFKTTLSFQNLTQDELSLLLYAMGVNQDYMLKIGGAKPRCLGTVKLQPTKIKILNKDVLLTPEKMFESKDFRWIDEIMKSVGLLNAQSFNKFKEEMKPRFDTVCPNGNY